MFIKLSGRTQLVASPALCCVCHTRCDVMTPVFHIEAHAHPRTSFAFFPRSSKNYGFDRIRYLQGTYRKKARILTTYNIIDHLCYYLPAFRRLSGTRLLCRPCKSRKQALPMEFAIHLNFSWSTSSWLSWAICKYLEELARISLSLVYFCVSIIVQELSMVS